MKKTVQMIVVMGVIIAGMVITACSTPEAEAPLPKSNADTILR